MLVRELRLWFCPMNKTSMSSFKCLCLVMAIVCSTLLSLALGEESSSTESASVTTISQKVLDRVDSYVEMWLEKGHIPGMAIGVYRRGVPILAKGYGMADIESNANATETTLFQLASCSKQFTAAAIMLLVEEGKVSLDEKITKNISGLPGKWAGITVRHLLTHTSGIESYSDDPAMLEQNPIRISKDRLFNIISGYPMQFSPGDQWAYCDAGYVLLGFLIEEVSGLSYSEFMQSRVFRPLQMHNTHIDDGEMILKGRARGYTWKDGTLSNAKYFDPSWPYAAGSIITNVVDLANWDKALYSDVLLPENRLKQMWTPVTLNDGNTFPYGFGWGILDINGHRCLAHCGGIAGFHSCISRYPDDELTVVVLQNEEYLLEPLALMKAAFMAQSIAGFIEPDLMPKVDSVSTLDSSEETETPRRFLSKLIEGESVRDYCSDEFWKVASNDFRLYQEFFEPFRPSTSVKLTHRHTNGDNTLCIYQIVFSSTSFLFQVECNTEDGIEGLDILAEIPQISL